MGYVLVQRSFEFNPSDVFVAFHQVVTANYGRDAFDGVRGWLRKEPLMFVNIKTNHSTDAEAVVKMCRIKGIKGVFDVRREFIRAYVSQKIQPEVELLLAKVEDHLKLNSIYKGKALRVVLVSSPEGGGFMPHIDFLDTSRVSCEELIYNQDVFSDIRTHVWNLMERPRECLDMGLKLRRKVLFKGIFGSGKTSAAILTAEIARRNGWTFVCLEPTVRQASVAVPFVLEFGRKYQRSCLLIEDFDREQREGDSFALGSIMSAVDNILAKTSEMIVIMTTNFGEKLAAGFQRPGRIDKIIDFNKFEPEDAKRLLETVIKTEHLAPDIDWDSVLREAVKYPPAFINGVGEAAKLRAIDKTDKGAKPIITQEMLIKACKDLRAQYKACTENSLGFSGEANRPPLETEDFHSLLSR